MSSTINTEKTGVVLPTLATHLANLEITDETMHHRDEEEQTPDDISTVSSIASYQQADLTLAPPNTQDPGFHDGEPLDTSDQMFYYKSNLVQQEKTYGRGPIFKRGLLRKIKHKRRVVLRASTTSDFYRTVSLVTHQLSDGRTFKVWKYDLQEEDNITWVGVWYMARVEFDPEFQRQFGDYIYQLPLLRKYNEDVYSEGTHLLVPYVFEPCERILPHDPNSKADYINKLKRSKSLWEGRKSQVLLKETFIGAAAVSAPITRIVCFGLGELKLKGKLPHSR
jgi:hypothetical protein